MLTVINSTFSGNGSDTIGGGGINNDGTLTVTNSTFSANSVSFCEDGGGINNSRTLTVTNTIFSGNSACDGGGIYNEGRLTVTNSTFSKNEATFEGGGIKSGESLTVTNSTFSNNSSAGPGGGIFDRGGTSTITNSIFSGNKASGGAGVYGGGTVINSTFSDNIGLGSIIECGVNSRRCDAPPPERNAGIITNSTFSRNIGGAIYNVEATLTITNSTFSGNSALGGAIHNLIGSSSFKNSILAASGIGGNCSNSAGSTITDAGYNISDDTTCGFAKTGSANNGDGVNPLLSPAGLADNGGPTETIALQDGSPAINAVPIADCADQASAPKPITSDQRGFPRPDAGEQVCDIGAYELQDTPVFAGHPGKANCHGKSVSALAQKYGGMASAASALGFPSVKALQEAIKAFCGA
jgi:predicted outer membrane repeat protein